ncbi:DUF1064 domain-containing protein [Cupriavidus nantongensis]
MTGLWGKWGNANRRGVAARMRGQVGNQPGAAGDQSLPDGGGKEAGRRGGGKASAGRAGGMGSQEPKPSKYRNTRVTVGGETFDSQREMERYHHLRILQRAGRISELERQVVFELAPAVVVQGRKRPPLKYVADFTYVEEGASVKTVEDVKGHITEGYRIKRHLMAAMGFQIKEVR